MSESADQRDMAQLVEEHATFLYRLGYRLSGSAQDAEDLVQQAFLAAQQHLDQVREPSSTRAWLATVLRNAWRRSFRRRDAGPAFSFDDVGEPAELPVAERELDAEELQAALDELPEEFRTAIVMYYLESLSYREIAEALEIPIGTVMSRLSRGKAWLRQRLNAVTATDRPAC
ncbi:MAG: sigma-70 family RNA polymerase sigma factor [Planctomycetaceae bacterium]